MKKLGKTVVALLILNSAPVHAQDPTTLPLLQIEDLVFQGAFNIPNGIYGESASDYAGGAIEYNPANHSIYLAGKNVDGAIAELAIPELVNSTTLTDLNDATFLQEFKRILNETPDGNPQLINRVTGMKLYNGKLIVNAVEYYDAPANNTHTSLVIEDTSDIANSSVTGYYSLEGAAHVGGWISPIPTEWQTLLGGNFIGGMGAGYPIAGRNTMGPSAFVIDPSQISGTPSGTIATTALLDFDLADPLYADFMDAGYANAYYNLASTGDPSPPSAHTFADIQPAEVGSNDLWTSESTAKYGLIVPGTRTYMTLGASGGHSSGIGYKPTQDNGNLCGGPCPYIADDVYNYYWLWDVNGFLEVLDGIKQPYELRPYSYGVFDVPFQTDLFSGGNAEHHPISGGAYDTISGLLYLTVYDGGAITQYDRSPLIAVYDMSSVTVSVEDMKDGITEKSISITPNPTADVFSINLENGIVGSVIIYNELGQEIKRTSSSEMNVSDLPSGIYFIKVASRKGEIVFEKLVKR